jgi:hypothetical protein
MWKVFDALRKYKEKKFYIWMVGTKTSLFINELFKERYHIQTVEARDQ